MKLVRFTVAALTLMVAAACSSSVTGPSDSASLNEGTYGPIGVNASFNEGTYGPIGGAPTP